MLIRRKYISKKVATFSQPLSAQPLCYHNISLFFFSTFHFHKSRTEDLRVKNNPKTKFESQINTYVLHLWPIHHLSLFIQTKLSLQAVMQPIPFVPLSNAATLNQFHLFHFQMQPHSTLYSRINLKRRLTKGLR